MVYKFSIAALPAAEVSRQHERRNRDCFAVASYVHNAAIAGRSYGRRQATVFQAVLIGWIIIASMGVPLIFLQPGASGAEPLPPALQLSIALLGFAGTALRDALTASLVREEELVGIRASAETPRNGQAANVAGSAGSRREV
jgi:hypothetical protein